MSILSCFDTNDHGMMWCIGYSVIIGADFISFLYGIIPIIMYWQIFKSLPQLNSATRYAFTFSLLAKSLFHIASLLIGKFDSSNRFIPTFGIVFEELPSYFISTSYTLVLMFWLSICLQILPYRYARAFKITYRVLVAYNIFFYLAFITCIIFNLYIIIKKLDGDSIEKVGNKLTGIVSCCRDFVLCLIFWAFILALKIGLKEDSYTEKSKDEKNLVIFTITLSVFVLSRGILAVCQGAGAFSDKNTNHNICGPTLFSTWVIQELLIEMLPLCAFLGFNNDFLVEQNRKSYDAIPSFYGSSLDN